VKAYLSDVCLRNSLVYSITQLVGD